MNAVLARPEPRLQRTEGEGRASFLTRDGKTALATLHQGGAAKIRLPRARGIEAEAVLINSSGGLAGGDQMRWRIEAGAGARVVVTTQACERAYRTLGETARVEVDLTVGAGARLDWLPQETILYDRSALARTLSAQIAPGGTLLVCEPVLLGRLAHGETVRAAHFHDRWRIRRGGVLVLAEDTRLDGEVDRIAARAATLGGGAAYASLALITDDPEPFLLPVRQALEADDGAFGGASAFDGKLICRLVAQDGQKLRRSLIPILKALRGGLDLPRSWMS